ncbi:peptide ABC transporter permease [Bosea sp. (in: a-proteobacteria)]|uniref:peptide ABC transporter permease n=1 Tax=Bosea sp. (in: a-proteobacteria) TaxID=1871050 RepID=UPI00262A0D06|nr:peptide ABC transporter permease [Bosea sp. (in: a-proteobacteria)]MCO5089396.1 peptide ABC transporter permease [Bosea sp. (in: a-proteobacteria)]
MIRNNAQAPLHPATDAALLLRRIGFGTLALVLPLAALVSRRAAVVLVPIGVALLIIAMLIEEPRKFVATLRDLVLSRPGVILIGLIGWAFLSLVWSPFPVTAAEKAGNLMLAVVLGFVGLSALPERMRSSNLNLVALGTGSAGLFALGLIAVSALRHAETVPGAVERGVSIILIMAWPALAWLLSRERGLSALGLALVVTLLALTRFEDGETLAMIFGAAAFGAVTVNPRRATRVIATIVAGLMLFAPVLPFLLAPLVQVLPDSADGFAQMLSIWADVIRQSPVELITGHGLDTVVRGQMSGTLPQPAPATLLFETWYELGLVGAAAGAACLYFAIRAAGRMTGALAAGGVAAFTTAFALSVFGFAPLLPWWLMTLTAVMLLFGAVARGQYRTDRPAVPLPARPVGQTRPKAARPPVG